MQAHIRFNAQRLTFGMTSHAEHDMEDLTKEFLAEFFPKKHLRKMVVELYPIASLWRMVYLSIHEFSLGKWVGQKYAIPVPWIPIYFTSVKSI